MKKIILLTSCLAALLLFSCGTDEEPPIECPGDAAFGLVDLETNSISFISKEMRDSTISIFVHEDGTQKQFFISDGNGGQDYIKRMPEKSPTVNCGDQTLTATYTPEEFYLILEAEDGRSQIEWQITIEPFLDTETSTIKLRDVMLITATGNINGIMTLYNDKSDPNEAPVLQGGAMTTEVRLHGVPYLNPFFDQPIGSDGSIDEVNFIVNLDYGIAGFQDQMNDWWRHIDFK